MTFGDDAVRVATSSGPATGAKKANVDAVGERRAERVTGRAYVADIRLGAGTSSPFADSGRAGDCDDRDVAWLARRQLGVATVRQLQALGRSRATIARKVRRGALSVIARNR